MTSERRFYLYNEQGYLGLYTSDVTPEIGQPYDVETSDSEFAPYIVVGSNFPPGEVPEFTLAAPTRVKNFPQLRRATVNASA